MDTIKLIWILLTALIISACSNNKINPCNDSSTVYTELNSEVDKKICFKTIDSYDLNYEDKPEIVIYVI